MFKRFVFIAAFCAILAMLVSCSTLDRMQRLDAAHALQRVNYLNPDAVNLWPFFFATGDYVSVMWPMADWDSRGFAVRPLVNKENDDWSLLFPLAGWDSGNGNGWCAIGYWFPSSRTYGVFPIFHYSGKDNFFFAGPFWGTRRSYGFFPLVWVGDDEVTVFPIGYFYRNSTTVFPLFYADKNKFLSIPFSYAKKQDDVSLSWTKTVDSPKGFDGWKQIRDWRWYYALLWYGGHNDCNLIDKQNPAAEYAEAASFYNTILARNLYMRDKGTKVSENEAMNYVKEKQVSGGYEAKEHWYGLFPFFHYESFYDLKKGPDKNDPYFFNAFWGLAGAVRRTPAQNLTNVFGPLGYLRDTTHSRGNSAVESKDNDLLWSALLYLTEDGSHWKMTKEAAFRFQNVRRADLEYRLKLYLDEDIKKWENDFAQNQKNAMRCYKITYVPCGTYNRPIYRMKPIPTPKTRKEVEALLAEFNNPKNYTYVQESTLETLPFYLHKTITRDKEVSSDTRTLFGLLSCFQKSKYNEFQHILGPFAYLHSVSRKEGEYEHEKSRDEFSMSLLAYRLSKDRWEIKKEASKQYRGVNEDELRRRIVLTDKKEISEWEQNFKHSLDAESELDVPKDVNAVRTLIAEKNATANYEANHESGFGVAPFFAHREHRNLTDTGVFLDLLFRWKRSPSHDITHLLGPVGFYRSRKSNEPAYACQKTENNFFVSMLYYNGSAEWNAFTPEAEKKFSAVNVFQLRQRFRMVNPKEIANWENAQNADFWFADPKNPRKAPASAAEAKALYKDYYDIANYRALRRDYWGVFPFFHTEKSLDSVRFYVLGEILSAWEKSPQRDYFHLFGILGYSHDKRTSAPDSPVEHCFMNEKTSMFLCYSDTAERNLRTAESEKKYSDLPAPLLHGRICMGDHAEAKKLADWNKEFELAVWNMDPRSTRTAPDSLAAAKKQYLEYNDPANYAAQVTKERGVFPFVHRKLSDVSSEFNLLSGCLLDWNEEHSLHGNDFFFHLLGPVFYRKTTARERIFEHERKDTRFTLAALLGYKNYDLKHIRTDAGKKQTNFLDRHQIEQMLRKYDPKQVEELMKMNTRLDGTTAFPTPKNSADAKKLWLDYNADGNFKANPYESFGVAPLFHFGSDSLGLEKRYCIPPLLSWHTANADSSKTFLFAGLLYYGSERSRKNPLLAEWVSELPGSYEIYSSEKPFIEGDMDFERNSFEGSTSRLFVIAGNNRGKALFWKKGSPKNLSTLYGDLSFKPEHKMDLEFMKKLGLDTAKTATWLGRAQLRKQIIDKWVEVRDISERGRLGRIFYRYARCGDDAAFWLGSGLLAKYTRQDGAEDTTVFGFLYRSHKDAKSSARVIFPFIASSEDESGTQFSFLWRLVNVKKSKTGDVSGHLMFIPF